MYYFFELIFLSLFLLLLGLYLWFTDICVYMDWNMVLAGGTDFCYQVIVDYYGVLFMSIILLISGFVGLYSQWYMSNYKSRFFCMLFGFISSMLILVISPNLMGMLLGWDGLGFVSFFLVLFYYGSEPGLDSALITLYYNRLGDGFLLIGICWMLLGENSCSNMWEFDFGIGTLMLLGLSTKSAQFPFMSWLPKAMSAPTPISSLVHSSTLVTAGVYMMVRFFDSITWCKAYTYISMITMVLASLFALIEMDLKKIIAYSTLSQLGLMVYGLSMGLKDYVYFHMLMHAIFKSMMFMSGGIMIHEWRGWQDIRYFGGCTKLLPYSSSCLLSGSFSLSGMYFLSGYYSKEIIIEKYMSTSMSITLYLMFYVCMISTLLYSIRLFDYLHFNCMSLTYAGSTEGLMGVSMIVLSVSSVFYGWALGCLIYEFSFFNYTSMMVKYYLLLLNLFVLFYLFKIYMDSFLTRVSGDLHKFLKNFMWVGSLPYLDKFWIEGYGGLGILSNLNKLIFSYKDYSIYTMFMLIFFIYLLY